MRLRAPTIDVTSERPFANDKLDRRAAVESLTNILKSSTDPLVVSVNAPWGFGKSTFLRMLEAHLSAEGIKHISFNAWASDYLDDPFVALLGDTEEQLNSLRGGNRSIQSNIGKAKKYGGKIIRAAIPAAVRIGTAGVINLDDLTESAIADAAEKFAQDQINAYTEAKKSISSFQRELKEIAETLYGADSELPLVFIIDELDRCRPTHAVRLLEIVKHFFSIDRVAFVIALDPDQLGHSVRTMYGQGMDVDGYLKRFFDLELNLPNPTSGEFLQAQFTRFGLDQFFADRMQHQETRYDKDRLESMFRYLFVALGFSFRERERAFSLLSLAIRATAQNQYLHPLMLGCLILLKIKNSALYRNFVSGRATATEIVEYFSSEAEGRKFMQSNYGYVLEAELIGALTPRHEQADLYRRFTREAEDETLTGDARQRAEIIAHVAQEKRFSQLYSNIKSVASKIDLVAGEG
ncbi:KAP family P-loop NTPase fold protein [Luteimonas sp. e5]